MRNNGFLGNGPGEYERQAERRRENDRAGMWVGYCRDYVEPTPEQRAAADARNAEHSRRMKVFRAEVEALVRTDPDEEFSIAWVNGGAIARMRLGRVTRRYRIDTVDGMRQAIPI